MDEYFVYAFLDPRKPGTFSFDDLKFDYEPFYIGKGKQNRMERHKYDKTSSFKRNIINKIAEAGLEPIKVKLFENLNEAKAFELERKTIERIGRRNIGMGSLANMTDGGEGMSGWIPDEKELERRKNFVFTEEHRQKISKTSIGRMARIPQTEKSKEILRTKCRYECTNEIRDKISKNSWANRTSIRRQVSIESKIYKSIREAARIVGVSKDTITHRCASEYYPEYRYIN